jgi:hypothetical protein
MSDAPVTEAPDIVALSSGQPGRVETAFVLIEQAARLIAVVDPAAIAASIRAGIEASVYTDPTLALRYMAQADDMDRKLAILDDAARLVSHWTIERGADHG